MASDRDKAVREAAVNKAVEDGATYEWGYHKTAEIAYDLGFEAGKRHREDVDPTDRDRECNHYYRDGICTRCGDDC